MDPAASDSKIVKKRHNTHVMGKQSPAPIASSSKHTKPALRSRQSPDFQYWAAQYLGGSSADISPVLASSTGSIMDQPPQIPLDNQLHVLDPVEDESLTSQQRHWLGLIDLTGESTGETPDVAPQPVPENHRPYQWLGFIDLTDDSNDVDEISCNNFIDLT